METVGEEPPANALMFMLWETGGFEGEDEAEGKKGKTNGERTWGREWDETLGLKD